MDKIIPDIDAIISNAWMEGYNTALQVVMGQTIKLQRDRIPIPARLEDKKINALKENYRNGGL